MSCFTGGSAALSKTNTNNCERCDYSYRVPDEVSYSYCMSQLFRPHALRTAARTDVTHNTDITSHERYQTTWQLLVKHSETLSFTYSVYNLML